MFQSIKALRFSRQELALMAITLLWGTTFSIVQYALNEVGPMFFLMLRFGSATLAVLCLGWKHIFDITLLEIIAGTCIGVCMYIGYGMQIFALQTVPSSKVAFLTALYVPLVPVFQGIIMRKMPHFMSWIGILFACIGLVFMAVPQGASSIFDMNLSFGEILTLIGTVAIAGEIIFISIFAGKVDVRRVVMVQLAVCGIIASIVRPITGEVIPPVNWKILFIACGMGSATAIIQLVMNWAQKTVSPTRATVIYAGEPVCAGAVGRIAGEVLPFIAVIGGLLVVCGILISEWRPSFLKKK